MIAPVPGADGARAIMAIFMMLVAVLGLIIGLQLWTMRPSRTLRRVLGGAWYRKGTQWSPEPSENADEVEYWPSAARIGLDD